jgi:hypothetical protein
MCKITISDVRAGASAEFTAELGFEKHFPDGAGLGSGVGDWIGVGVGIVVVGSGLFVGGLLAASSGLARVRVCVARP